MNFDNRYLHGKENMCVEFKGGIGVEDMMQVLGLNETIDQLLVASSVCCCGLLDEQVFVGSWLLSVLFIFSYFLRIGLVVQTLYISLHALYLCNLFYYAQCKNFKYTQINCWCKPVTCRNVLVE